MSNSIVKYRHPAEHSLEWSGKGRQPKWVEAYLANGGSLVSLEVAVQHRDEINQLEDMLDEAESGSADIDLGIGETPAVIEPTFAEKLYGDRIAAGLHPVPENGDPSFTPGVRQVVAAAEAQAASVQVVDATDSSQQQLEVCLHEFGLIGLTVEEFVRAGVDDMNQATVRMCRAGVAFWAAQEALKNKATPANVIDGNASADVRTNEIGALSADVRTKGMDELIAEIGMPKERVYEAIRVAKFYSRLPDVMRGKALSIGKSNALLLASLPPDVIDKAAESGNDLIGKADMMTVAELKEEIKALQRREKNYEAELERTNSQVKRLSEAKTRTTDFLLRTEELREECMALQLGAELHLNSLRKLFEDTDPEAPEGKLQMEHLWIVANALAARSLDLLDFMRARATDDMPSRIMTQHMLTPDEAIRWLQDYPLIENRFAAEAAVRESRREAARPRGPGRPSGSKNKGAKE